MSNNTARTFVWTPRDERERVVAYYSLAGHVIERSAMPAKIGRGSPDSSPAVLLARLAVAKNMQGEGLGAMLLAEALTRAARTAQIVAARFVVVDAIDESAAMFYARYGFTRILGDSRLFRKMSDIARDVLQF